MTCKQCNKEMYFDTITVEHGYGSEFDGETWYFCSLNCYIVSIIELWLKNKYKERRT